MLRIAWADYKSGWQTEYQEHLGEWRAQDSKRVACRGRVGQDIVQSLAPTALYPITSGVRFENGHRRPEQYVG